jgi:hypothetical protein
LSGPVSMGSAPAGNDLSKYFGPRLTGYVDSNSGVPIIMDTRWQKESGEYYTGKNQFLADRIEEKVMEAGKSSVYTTVVLPYMYIQELRYVFTTVKPNPTLAAVAPNLGVQKLQTTRREHVEGKMERYGLKFQLEHDFYMKGPAGEREFVNKIRETRANTQRTVDALVIRTIDESMQMYDEWLHAMGKYETDADRLRDAELSTYMCFNKLLPQELGVVIDRVRSNLKVSGGDEPDTALVPEGFGSRFQSSPVEASYEIVEKGTNSLKVVRGPNAAAKLGNVNLFEAKRVDVEDIAFDPFSHNSQIGEFYPLHNRVQIGAVGADPYTSKSQTIFIHDESVDDFRPITLDDAIDNCQRFYNTEIGPLKPFAALSTPENNMFAKWGDVSRDPFVKSNGAGGWTDVKTFDDMDKNGFITTDLKALIMNTLRPDLAVNAAYKTDDGGVHTVPGLDPGTSTVPPVTNWEQFASIPINKHNILKLVRLNVLMPFSFIIARPWQTFETADVVLMKGGMDTGCTFVGGSHATTGMDTSTGFWEVNYVFYASPAIYQRANVIKIKDAYCRRYRFGRDTQFVDLPDVFPGSDKLATVHEFRSVIPILCGYYDAMLVQTYDPTQTKKVKDRQAWKTVPNPLPLFGEYFNTPLYLNRTLPPANLSAEFMQFAFPDYVRAASDAANTRGSMASLFPNSLCYLGDHYYYNATTKKFDGHTMGTGHLGIYGSIPGTAAARKGVGTFPHTMYTREGLSI